MAAPQSTAPRKQVLDFTNVKESTGVNPKHVPAGDYRMKITKVTEQAKKSDANVMQWVFLFTPTDMQSASYPYYCQLEENTLWKIRNLLIACGIQVPKKRVNVDPSRLVGKEIGVTLDDDEYEGKMKSVITAVFPASDLDDSDTPAQDDDDEDVEDTEDDAEEAEEEPEPAPVAKKKKAAPKPAPVEDDDEVTEDDMDEIDIEDL